MWIYEKKLEYPVKITKPDPRAAKVIISQYGGGNGIRYKNGNCAQAAFSDLHTVFMPQNKTPRKV